MVEKLVTIATYSNPIDANLAKIKLASEDIDCFLAGENAVAIYGSIVGTVKLQVRESDVETATEVLNRPPDEKELDEPENEDSPEEPPDKDELF
jgi:hypothetical protein